MCIRQWAKQFYLHNNVTQSKRGKHSKSISLLTHEDVKSALLSYLRAQKAGSISISSFCNAAKVILEQKGYGEEMSESTARRWLFRLGFFRWEYKKGIYVDGHERPDVVAYRKYFVVKMAEYRKRMTEYCGADMSDAISPDPANGRELVLVVHDECCFNSHEGMSTIWVEKGRTPLRPKGRGRSYMVSEFLCQCHGHLELNDEQMLQLPLDLQFRIAQRTLKPGANAEGYWTGEHVVAQLKQEAIAIFDILHPGKQALFMFDNSSNHNVFAPDALKCSHLNLSNGGA
eukprot:gene44767-55707_t